MIQVFTFCAKMALALSNRSHAAPEALSLLQVSREKQA